jgi:hypothetical protein
VLGGRLVILLDWRLVDLDVLGLDDGANLDMEISTTGDPTEEAGLMLTLDLNLARSAGLRVSALAITGMRLTREPRRFMTSMSRGLRVWPVGRMK